MFRLYLFNIILAKFMMNYIHSPFIDEPHHHHHPMPNPIELAQISGASQYAKLNTKLQKHIEDDERHLKDGERDKWNKVIYDLGLLKDKVNDLEDDIEGGGSSQNKLISQFINDVPYAKRSDLDEYATQAWVRSIIPTIQGDFATKTYVNELLGNYYTKSQSDQKYIQTGSILGTINGQTFRHGSSITIEGGGGDTPVSDAHIRELAREQMNNGISIIDSSYIQGLSEDKLYDIATISWPNGKSHTIKGAIFESGGGGGSVKTTDLYFRRSSSSSEMARPSTLQELESNWGSDAPKGSGEYIWAIEVTKIDGVVNSWKNPFCINANGGAAGKDGLGYKYIFRRTYNKWENPTAPTQSQGDEYKEENWTPRDEYETIAGRPGAGDRMWSDNARGVDPTLQFEYVSIRKSKIGTDGKTATWSNDFSVPKLWSNWSEDGVDGNSVEYIYSCPVSKSITKQTLDRNLTYSLNVEYADIDNDTDKSIYTNNSINNVYQTIDEVSDIFGTQYDQSEPIMWFDNPSDYTGSYLPGQFIYCAVRKRVGEVWGPFSVPEVWGGKPELPGDVTGQSSYNMVISPSVLKKDAYGHFIGGDTVSVSVYYKQPIEEDPGSYSYTELSFVEGVNQDHNLTVSVLGSDNIERTLDSFTGTIGTYQFTQNEAKVSFLLKKGGVLIQNLDAIVDVDTSVVIGQDAVSIQIENDTVAVGCDSDNKIPGGGDTLNQQCYVSVYKKDQKLQITSLKVWGTEMNESDELSGRLIGDASSNIYAVITYEELRDNVATLTINDVSSYNNASFSKSSVNIPVTIVAQDSSGNTYTRTGNITVLRINSGAPGEVPVKYSFQFNADTFVKEINATAFNPANVNVKIFKQDKDGFVQITSTNDLPTNLFVQYGEYSVIHRDANVWVVSLPNKTASKIIDTNIGSGINIGDSSNECKDNFGNNPTFSLVLNSQTHDHETLLFIDKSELKGEDGQGQQGLAGCVIRRSILDDGVAHDNTITSGGPVPDNALTHYRNDEDLTFDEGEQITTRYIDIVGVPNSNATDGYYWFKVTKSNVLGESKIIAATNYGQSYYLNPETPNNQRNALAQLERFKNNNVTPTNTYDFEYIADQYSAIYTSLIMAKYAKIKFQTNNELTIVKTKNGQEIATAGLTGGGSGDEAVRIWAGGDGSDLNTAPFRVTESGKLYATNAYIEGEIHAKEGKFSGNVVIDGNVTFSGLNNAGSIRFMCGTSALQENISNLKDEDGEPYFYILESQNSNVLTTCIPRFSIMGYSNIAIQAGGGTGTTPNVIGLEPSEIKTAKLGSMITIENSGTVPMIIVGPDRATEFYIACDDLENIGDTSNPLMIWKEVKSLYYYDYDRDMPYDYIGNQVVETTVSGRTYIVLSPGETAIFEVAKQYFGGTETVATKGKWHIAVLKVHKSRNNRYTINGREIRPKS